MDETRLAHRSKWVGRGIVLGSALLYLATFPTLRSLVGDSATMLSVVPVAAAGWYFGVSGGVGASLIAIAVNVALLLAAIEGGSNTLDIGLVPGSIMLALVGAIAGALQRALLARERAALELFDREEFFARLGEITTKALSAPNPTPILQDLTLELADLFGADDCYITRWDPVQEQVSSYVASSRAAKPPEDFRYEPGEPNLTAAVLAAGHAIAVEDATASPLVNRRLQALLPYRSLLGIPLAVKDRKLGAVLIAYASPHRFKPNEIYRAKQAGNQIAFALWEIQQDAEVQRRLHESIALSDIGRALSETERVGLDHVLQLIVDSARELIPETERAVIHLLDEERQMLIPRAVTGSEKPDAGKMKMRLGEGVAGQVIAEGISINISNVEADPRFLRQDSPLRYRSLMVAPVQSGNGRLGTISVQSAETNAFSDDELRLLESLGNHASIAIENAHLLETTQQGLKEVNALYRIAQGLVASLDTGQLMKEVVDLLQQNFGYYHVHVYEIEADTGDLVLKQGSGEIGARLLGNGHRMKAGEGIIGHVVETGKPFVTNNVQDVLFFASNPSLPLTQSELATPIIVNRRVLGVLDVQNAPPARLTERDLQLVSAVADQLAVALQKASFYSDLQTALAQEKSMRSQLIQSERLALVGRLLASVSHELNNPLQAIQNALFLLQEENGISTQGRQDLQIVLSETERMAGLIERLRTTYRSTRVQDLQPVQVNGVVEDVYALMATHLRHNNIAFEFHPAPNLPFVAGLPDQIRQVILNLLMNGVEAMPSGGRLAVSTELLDTREVLLTVSDTGPGIDPDLLPHIFDPFVSSKDSGTGLGLTITYDIIQRHNARILAENNAERGATFKIWFPAHAQEELS